MKGSNRWFATLDSHTLCRGGGNGPINVTNIFPLVKYTKDGESFLDVGSGSGSTIDALRAIKREVKYKGVDVIEKHIRWLQEEYPATDFEVQDARHLKEADKSWDVVWSRHVVDHLGSFEEAMDEHCRVAKKRVICVLWMSFSNHDEHEIKPIIEDPFGARRKEYKDEWTNQYSRKKVQAYLDKKVKQGWDLVCFKEDCPWDLSRGDKGQDIVIVLERTDG